MRRGFKGATERDIERQLDQVILIFRYLQDKDVFESYYKQYLAKRLLHARSTPSDAERSMLAKLKGECGYQYTTKLEGMFTDIRFSKDAMDKYRAHRDVIQSRLSTTTPFVRTDDSAPMPPTWSNFSEIRTPALHASPEPEVSVSAQTALPVDVDVTTLTAGYWPMQATVPCHLPTAAQAACELFQHFYLKQHTGRKLTWLTSAGSAEIRATFNQTAKHELTVSTYMMCILVLFDDLERDAELSLVVLATQTQIPQNELKRHVVSLCTPKHRILLKKSKGKGVADDDVFKVNASFSSKLKRVRVPLVAMKEAGALPDSSDKVPPAVEEDRRHLCEATVVRIMKARKCAKHNDLIAEVRHRRPSAICHILPARPAGHPATQPALLSSAPVHKKINRVPPRTRISRARHQRLKNIYLPGVSTEIERQHSEMWLRPRRPSPTWLCEQRASSLCEPQKNQNGMVRSSSTRPWGEHV